MILFMFNYHYNNCLRLKWIYYFHLKKIKKIKLLQVKQILKLIIVFFNHIIVEKIQ